MKKPEPAPFLLKKKLAPFILIKRLQPAPFLLRKKLVSFIQKKGWNRRLYY
jgi:hypothetical protein